MTTRCASAWFVSVLFAAFPGAAPAQGSSRPWVEIPVKRHASYHLGQIHVPDGDTGPASFLNALRFGPEVWQSGLGHLGTSRQERLDALRSRLLGSSPGHAAPLDHFPFRLLASEIASLLHPAPPAAPGAFPALAAVEVAPAAGEDAAALVRKFHGHFVRSTGHGVPVVLAWDTLAVTVSPGARWSWEGRRHAMVQAVPKTLPGGALGFSVDLLDPLDPGPGLVQAWIAGREMAPTAAPLEIQPEKAIRSPAVPLLTLHGAPLDAFDHSAWAQRRIVVLSWAQGAF
jgi:hypothetical protein